MQFLSGDEDDYEGDPVIVEEIKDDQLDTAKWQVPSPYLINKQDQQQYALSLVEKTGQFLKEPDHY